MAEEKEVKKSQFERDLDALSTQHTFARMVRYIKMERERCIKEMHDVSTEGVQQLSGRILQADDLMDAFKWEELEKRHRTALEVV